MNPARSFTNNAIINDFPPRARPIITTLFVLRFPVEITSYSISDLFFKYSKISSVFQIGIPDISENGSGNFESRFLQFDTLLLLVSQRFAISLNPIRSLSITIKPPPIIIVHLFCEFNSHCLLIA